jgi:hypothetical protein
MSTMIHTYVLVDTDNEDGDIEYDTLEEARNAASQMDEPHAIIEKLYTFSDSNLIETPDGGDVWPPNVPEDEQEVIGGRNRY